MNKVNNAQLKVKPGDRVEIVVPGFNIKYGTDEVYPNHGTGTVISFTYGDGTVVPAISEKEWQSYGYMAFVKLDEPFKRKGLVEKPVLMETMWVPTCMLRPEQTKKGT